MAFRTLGWTSLSRFVPGQTTGAAITSEGSRAFIGTSEGTFVELKVISGKEGLSIRLASQTHPSKSPIEQVSVLADANAVALLTGGMIVLVDLEDLGHQTVHHTRGATLLAGPPASEPNLFAIAAKTSVTVFKAGRQSGGIFAKQLKTISFPEAPLSLALFRETAIVGSARAYYHLDLIAGRRMELFALPPDQKHHPVAKMLGAREEAILFVQGLGIHVDSDGNPLGSTLPLSVNLPRSIVQSYPYILHLANDEVWVYDLATGEILQSICLSNERHEHSSTPVQSSGDEKSGLVEDGAGDYVLAYSGKRIALLVQVQLSTRAEELFQCGKYEAAIEIAEGSDENWSHDIARKASFALLAQGNCEAALDALKKVKSLPVCELLRYHQPLAKRYQERMRACDVSELQATRGEASNTNGDAKGLPKGFGKVGFQRMANGFYGVSEKERTPLADLVAVLLAESGDLDEFSRFCLDFGGYCGEPAVELFREQGWTYCEAMVKVGSGALLEGIHRLEDMVTGKAADAVFSDENDQLRRQAILRIVEATPRLSREEDIAEHILWLAQEDEQSALECAKSCLERGSVSVQKGVEISATLNNHSRREFLEFAVYSVGTEDPRVHTDLALSYVADIFARGDEPNPHLKLCDDWGSESQSRQRLLHHLWSSNMIQAGQVLDQLQNTGKIPAKRDDGFLIEQVMLRRINGETETALRQLINGLQDFEAAERFCEAASSRREKFSLLGSVFNMCVERPGEMARNMTNFASREECTYVRLLVKHNLEEDGRKVVEAMRDDEELGHNMEAFTHLLQHVESRKRERQVQRALSKVAHQSTMEDVWSEKKQGIVIRGGKECTRCSRPLAIPTTGEVKPMIRLPDTSLICFRCYEENGQGEIVSNMRLRKAAWERQSPSWAVAAWAREHDI